MPHRISARESGAVAHSHALIHQPVSILVFGKSPVCMPPTKNRRKSVLTVADQTFIIQSTPTKSEASKKAAKTDIAAIEYLSGDLDPTEGETSEAAKKRYLDQLNGSFKPKPTARVDFWQRHPNPFGD